MIKREIGMFLIVGVSTVFIDYLVYSSVIWVGVDLAKGIGFLTGTLFAFIANRFWTFGHKRHAAGSTFRFFSLYISTLVVNILANSFLLEVMTETEVSIQLAFLFATGSSAVLNFLGMKFFVFKSSATSRLI
jgi:putative flippase GtrA